MSRSRKPGRRARRSQYAAVFLLVVMSALCSGCRSADRRKTGLSAESSNPADSTDPSAMAVDKWFRTLPERFNAEEAKNIRAVYMFRLATEDRKTLVYTVAVDRGACKVARGGKQKYDTVLSSTCRDWLLLSSGKLSGAWAFITGRLRVSGDMKLARYLEKLFFQKTPEHRKKSR